MHCKNIYIQGSDEKLINIRDKRGLISVGIATIMVLSTLSFIATTRVNASPITLYVGGSGGGNYSSIQDAIDNASNGDTVFVYSGTYYENVGVTKSIDLVGEDKNNTIIDAQGNGTEGRAWIKYEGPTSSIYFSTILSKAESTSDIIRFAWMADPHVRVSSQDIATMVSTWQSVGYPKLDFVADLGDSVHESKSSEWDSYASDFVNNRVFPFFHITGNHDMMDFTGDRASGQEWKAVPEMMNTTGKTEETRAFIHKNVLFICLDDEADENILTSWQREFVDFITTRYSDKTTVILTHNKINDTTGHTGGAIKSQYKYWNYQNSTWWWNLFHNNPQIKLFCHGHAHKYDIIKTGGVIFVEDDGHESGSSNYIHMEIGDGYIEIAQRDKTGSVLDIHNYTGYSNNVSTTSFSKLILPSRIQDGMNRTLYNHYIADSYEVWLIGTNETNLGYNVDFDYYAEQGNYSANRWIGFLTTGDDTIAGGDGDNPQYSSSVVQFDGEDKLSMSLNYFDSGLLNAVEDTWIEGKYYYTLPRMIPGAEYKVSIYGKANTSTMDAMDVRMYLLGRDVDNIISTETAISGIDFTTSWNWYNGTFTVPSNNNIWLGRIEFESYGSNTYYLDAYKIEQNSTTLITSDFSLTIGSETNTYSGAMSHHQVQAYSLTRTTITGNLTINASIGGNHVGIYALVYNNPIMHSEDAILSDTGPNSVSFYGSNTHRDVISFSPYRTVSNVSGITGHTTGNGYTYYTTSSDSGSFTIGEFPQSLIILTNGTIEVEETSAILNGYLEDDGNELCTVWFEYGTTSSYGNNTSEEIKLIGEEFNFNLIGLSPGTLYHYRAVANNSIGTSHGFDKTFLSKPMPLSSFSAYAINSLQINLSWIDGSECDGAYIEFWTEEDDAWELGDHIKVGINGYVVSPYIHTGLTPETTYYYKAWAYAEDQNIVSDGSITKPFGDNSQTANVTTFSANGETYMVRSLPSYVNPMQETFIVTINVSNYGFFCEINETLPDGVEYVGSSLQEYQVFEWSNGVRFILVGETTFTYNVTTPTVAGECTFYGTLKDINKNTYIIGGDDTVMVWSPWIYDTLEPYGTITKQEVIDAIIDYFDYLIEKWQVIGVIQEYFT